MPVGPAGTVTSRGAMAFIRAGAGTTYSAIFARTSGRLPLVKTMPTLPMSFSPRFHQDMSPLRSQYSLMHLRIMVFLPMRIWESGRSACGNADAGRGGGGNTGASARASARSEPRAPFGGSAKTLEKYERQGRGGRTRTVRMSMNCLEPTLSACTRNARSCSSRSLQRRSLYFCLTARTPRKASCSCVCVELRMC